MKKIVATAMLLAGLMASTAKAQESYIGQIILGGWNFCPRGTTPAAGQLLPIVQNQALFSLYGTTYGGDGRTSFGLPDLRGRYATNAGQGPGLNPVRLGEKNGANTTTLSEANMPAHSHSGTGTASATVVPGNTPSPQGNLPALSPNAPIYAPPGGAAVDMAPNSIAVTTNSVGGGQSFSITDPRLGLTYCVVLMGIYPSRN